MERTVLVDLLSSSSRAQRTLNTRIEEEKWVLHSESDLFIFQKLALDEEERFDNYLSLVVGPHCKYSTIFLGLQKSLFIKGH